MGLSQTENGKAYEYACLQAIYERMLNAPNTSVVVVDSDALHTAKAAYMKAQREGVADNLTKAAKAAVRTIVRLEPQLEFGNGELYLTIQTDAQGISGDVRDVVCIRNTAGWEIGLSCKHNHHAVKHSRLSATIDFGTEWFGVPCSQNYFMAIQPVFNNLRNIRDSAISFGEEIPQWANVPDKAQSYYVPVLSAFLDELKRLAGENTSIPALLVSYMLGRYDFYKVITDDRHQTTRVEAINIAGTLNRPADGHHSIVDVPKLKLPGRFYHMGFVPDSNNTVEIICDEGWALNMRIHNASKYIEPSLKFDVQLISLPSSIHAQVEPW